MNTLRPGFPPPNLGAQPKPQPPPATGGIFELARAQAAAKAAAPTAAAPAPTAPHVNRMQAAPAEPAARPLRPGSLLDIRV